MFLNSVRALPDSSNQEALRLEAEGRQSLAQQDFQSAISSLYRAVGADPKFVRGWVMLGGLLMAVHQNDSGIDAFQKAVAIDPPEPAAQKIYALSLVSSHKLAESVPVWQSDIKLAPDDADGPTYLGAALMDLHRYDEAVPVFESAVRLDPNRAKSQINLGTVYLRTGAPQKADASFRKALELDPRPDALNRAAYAMAESDKTPPVARDFALQAVDALEKSIPERVRQAETGLQSSAESELRLYSPDGNPVRVLRWGTFICGPGGCEFMLPDATAARSTPMPIRSVH